MTQAYFNEKASIWDAVVAEKNSEKLIAMVSRLDIIPGSMLLDIGTGTGVFVPYLMQSLGSNGQIIALDFAEEMLKQARAKGFNGNIDYVQADISGIPLQDGIFDCAVCYSSFPHFSDKLLALQEINRVLRKDGMLHICHTAGRETINDIHRQIPAVQNHTIPDENEVRRLLIESGYVDIIVDDNRDNYLVSARKPIVPSDTSVHSK
jgi:ubiquinone/menaquinone biosynthesis C-methylase UbiE